MLARAISEGVLSKESQHLHEQETRSLGDSSTTGIPQMPGHCPEFTVAAELVFFQPRFYSPSLSEESENVLQRIWPAKMRKNDQQLSQGQACCSVTTSDNGWVKLTN